jgi:hypothetical protein
MSATRSPSSCAPGSPIPAIDVILTTGGTGLTGRDVTVEAHRDVYEKEIEAFATVFTMVSMQKIGTSAVQSRATGGVANGTYLFRAARLLGGLQGCVGRDPEMAARLPPPSLQLRRDPATPRRTSATEVIVTYVSWHIVRLGRSAFADLPSMQNRKARAPSHAILPPRPSRACS